MHIIDYRFVGGFVLRQGDGEDDEEVQSARPLGQGEEQGRHGGREGARMLHMGPHDGQPGRKAGIRGQINVE